MKFFGEPCATCKKYITSADGGIAFSKRIGGIQLVELNGKQPWSGVQMICMSCAGFFMNNTIITREAQA